MTTFFHQIPLYRMIACCEDAHMDKTILDCGAEEIYHRLPYFIKTIITLPELKLILPK